MALYPFLSRNAQLVWASMQRPDEGFTKHHRDNASAPLGEDGWWGDVTLFSGRSGCVQDRNAKGVECSLPLAYVLISD